MNIVMRNQNFLSLIEPLVIMAIVGLGINLIFHKQNL